MKRGSSIVLVVITGLGLALAGPSRSGDLYALLSTGELHWSGDGGGTWESRAAIPADAVALVAGVSSFRLHLASGSGQVFRSLDAGTTWVTIGSIDAPDLVGLAFRSDGHLLALTRAGIVFHSDDDGTTFTPLSVFPSSNMVGLAPAPDGALFALSGNGEVFRSGNLGHQWVRQAALPIPDAGEIVASSTDLFVMSRTGSVFRSHDKGITWSPVGALNQVHAAGFVKTPSGMFAATEEGHIARSTTGANWSWVGSVNQVTLRALASDEPQVSGTAPLPEPVPALQLGPAYPNPAPGRFQVDAVLADSEPVSIRLIDAAGRIVDERFDSSRTAGPQVFTWPPPGSIAPVQPSTGVYWLEVTQGRARGVTKVLLLKR